MRPDEKFARETVATSLTVAGGHSTAGMPWKYDKGSAPDNYSMALHRSRNNVKKTKFKELGQVYMKVLQTYKEEWYIHVVPREDIYPIIQY